MKQLLFVLAVCTRAVSLKTVVQEAQAEVPDGLRPDEPDIDFGVVGSDSGSPDGIGHMMALTVAAVRKAGGMHFACGSFALGPCPGEGSPSRFALLELKPEMQPQIESQAESQIESQLDAQVREQMEESSLEADPHVNLDHVDLNVSDIFGAEAEDSNTHRVRMKHVWHHDLWPGKGNTARKDGDEGFNFFTSAPVADWMVLLVVAIILCLADWFIFRHAPETFKWHIALIAIWIFFAFLYNMYILRRQGGPKAFEWCTGYLLEWMLSMDNLFVFHLIFSAYNTPYNQIHKAVFVGIIGAVGMRMLFFMVVSTLLHIFGWFRWPFGCLLVWSGIEAARADDDDDMDPEDTRLIRALKWCLGSRLSSKYDEKNQGCFVVEDGRVKATLLLVVIFCLEFTDILFALDSVSAKIAQIPDQYIAFSSSVLAMFGLRAMFFIIKDLVDMFDVLKYGLCLILVFIGVELMFSHWLKLASSTVCIMIVSVFVICISASHAKRRYFPQPPSDDEEHGEEKDKIKSKDSSDKIDKAGKSEGHTFPEPDKLKPVRIS